ncbi:hypothetical protein [Sporanaerobacter sp. PP17-6a]|uniref:hypothetical protein n=1 Tax=Sporanaerobacter sp. PP17-6a TaxID=1891289 RepID=UPI00089FCC4E|nr:hypothetical protein [Sporanaerobacter sp. PP17-6a]SCL83892.1 hypothetical protein PP176A_0558 [Sporanaerobacter sp. PP17-6a]
MTWKEVRKLYPNQFVKFKILKSHIEGNKEYVDEVNIIKSIKDGKEAMKEFIHCGEGQYVYSTKNKEVIIELVKHIGIRRSILELSVSERNNSNIHLNGNFKKVII